MLKPTAHQQTVVGRVEVRNPTNDPILPPRSQAPALERIVDGGRSLLSHTPRPEPGSEKYALPYVYVFPGGAFSDPESMPANEEPFKSARTPSPKHHGFRVGSAF